MPKFDFTTRVTDAMFAKASTGMEAVLDGVMPGWQDNPSTQNTANRFVKYLCEFTQPIDVEDIFASTFDDPASHPPMIIQFPIPFRMVCEHHLLPAMGVAALGYIPHSKVIGLSKLSRLVDAVGTEKPSLQEHIAGRIMNLMDEHLKPKGVMLVVKSQHGCMACRGVHVRDVWTTTSHVSGAYRDNVSARQEFLSLIQGEM